MKTSIYIASQTVDNLPRIKDYIPLIVGKPELSIEGCLNDSVGESISAKNPFYCELTGHYWIWKNDKQSDVVGLCHYRRFLWINDIKSRICRKNFTTIDDDVRHYLDTYKLEDILKSYDIILPRPYAFSKDNIKSQFIFYHGQSNYDLMINSIKQLYPEYMVIVESAFNRRFEYFANLMSTRKDIFDDYSKWLFAILQNIENNIDLNDQQNLRILGYIGERLLKLYVIQNKLRIKEVPLIFISKPEQNDDEDLYIDFRYIKRRYFSGILDIEEKIRNRFKRL